MLIEGTEVYLSSLSWVFETYFLANVERITDRRENGISAFVPKLFLELLLPGLQQTYNVVKVQMAEGIQVGVRKWFCYNLDQMEQTDVKKFALWNSVYTLLIHWFDYQYSSPPLPNSSSREIIHLLKRKYAFHKSCFQRVEIIRKYDNKVFSKNHSFILYIKTNRGSICVMWVKPRHSSSLICWLELSDAPWEP